MTNEIELNPLSISRENGESDIELRDRLRRKNASLLRKLKGVRQRRKADIRHYETVLRYSDKAANDSALRETALIEENERLKDALEKIKEKAELTKSEASNATYGFAFEIEELAREALKGRKK